MKPTGKVCVYVCVTLGTHLVPFSIDDIDTDKRRVLTMVGDMFNAEKGWDTV